MRFAIAHPCLGSSEIVFRIKRSSVPWTRSFGFAILWLSTTAIVDCQGMAAGYNSWEVGKSPMLRLAYFKLPRRPLTRLAARRMSVLAVVRLLASPQPALLREAKGSLL